MSIKPILIAAATFAVAVVGSAVFANADPVRVSGPAVHENLSIYMVHGSGAGGAAPLTLDQALANGSVKIHERTDAHPIQIENVSGQSVFIQLGDLIRGGLQDQVVGTTMLLPPHSGMTNLLTFCVDPFRSSARDGESANLFSATGAMFPWRLAKVGILSGTSEAAVVTGLRETAVWWSVDSLRAQLARKLGEPMESPKPAHWVETANRAETILAARQSPWKTSLPLALENRHLASAQQSFAHAFRRAGAGRGDVIGAVFAIDGQVIGADIYQSHALFRAMWPKLLRAYAAEALASGTTTATAALSREDVSAFLAVAAEGQRRESVSGGTSAIRDGATALYAETSDGKGQWVHRGYVPKLASDAIPVMPEALLVRMLETGKADGRSLASFDSRDTFPIRRTSDGWSVMVPPQWSALTHPTAGRNDSSVSLLFGWFAILALFLRPTLRLVWALGVHCVRKTVRLLAALAEGGRAMARFARHATALAAAAAANIVASLDPGRLALPLGLVRPATVAARRGYVRRVPAFAAVLAIALAIAPRFMGLW